MVPTYSMKLGDGNISTKGAASMSYCGDTKSIFNAGSISGNNNISSTDTSSKGVIPSKQIVMIERHDFAPEQVVLVFSNHGFVAIDDVGSKGQIDTKVSPEKLDNE